MPFQIIRNDITKVRCDAIVNAANSSLLGGGGVDGAIHRAAGKGLREECSRLHGCRTGEAKITGGYRLPCRYVIHTVGPVWKGGAYHEAELLASCYRHSLQLAEEYGCSTVAFPLIAAGTYGYPRQEALQIARDTIQSFLTERDSDMTVFLVVFDKTSFLISEKLYSDIRSFIDDHYVLEMYKDAQRYDYVHSESEILSDDLSAPGLRKGEADKASSPTGVHHTGSDTFFTRFFGLDADDESELSCAKIGPVSLEEMLDNMGESFSEMLLRKIDEKGMTDTECYKKANIDRKLFSKIRNDRQYNPSKTTVIAFAIALELSLAETKELLEKAGFALSHSSKSDIIIEYFITNNIYDVMTINEALFSFDQKLLGE